MTAYTLDPSLLAVLNGNIFGYLLHAIELVFAQVLFCFHLKRRNHFVLRFLLALCIMLSGSLGFGLFFERYFPSWLYPFAAMLLYGKNCFIAQQLWRRKIFHTQ